MTQHILRVIGKDFKGLREIDIKTEGAGCIIIAGRHEAGKTSVLDLIECVIGGKRHDPEMPIRRGASKSYGIIETEVMEVTREWKARGRDSIKVEMKDGSPLDGTAREVLDRLIGPMCFDLSEFMQGDQGKQAQMLRDFVGLNFPEEDARRAELYEQRTVLGREGKRLQGAIDTIPEAPKDTPDAEVSVSALNAELDKLRTLDDAQAEKARELEVLRSDLKRAVEGQDEAKKEFERARLRVEDATSASVDLVRRAANLSGVVDAQDPVDLDTVRKSIASAEDTNSAVRTKAKRADLVLEIEMQRTEYRNLSKAIEQIDTAKREAAEAAKYPIEGLELTDEGITLDGIPFKQIAKSAQIKVAAAIGFGLGGDLRILQMREAAYLNADARAAVAEVAEQHDGQVWFELPDPDAKGPSVFVIEDGAVKGVTPATE